jgi:hypothetical protein
VPDKQGRGGRRNLRPSGDDGSLDITGLEARIRELEEKLAITAELKLRNKISRRLAELRGFLKVTKRGGRE